MYFEIPQNPYIILEVYETGKSYQKDLKIPQGKIEAIGFGATKHDENRKVFVNNKDVRKLTIIEIPDKTPYIYLKMDNEYDYVLFFLPKAKKEFEYWENLLKTTFPEKILHHN